MSVFVKAHYVGQLDVICEHEQSGKVIQTTAPLDNGGRGDHFAPTDLLASAVGCCALTIMSQKAQEKGFDIVGTKVSVSKEMGADPRRVVKLVVAFQFPFAPTNEQMIVLEDAFKNCPVRNSLDKNIIFDVSYTVTH